MTIWLDQRMGDDLGKVTTGDFFRSTAFPSNALEKTRTTMSPVYLVRNTRAAVIDSIRNKKVKTFTSLYALFGSTRTASL